MSDEWGKCLGIIVLVGLVAAFPKATVLIIATVLFWSIPDIVGWIKRNTSNKKPWLDQDKG
jgi:hypothetical protein